MGNGWLDEVRPLLAEQQLDLDDVLAAIVDEVARRFDADRATIYLLDRVRRELVSRAAHLPEIAEIRLRLGEGVAGWVGQEGQPLMVHARDGDPRWSHRIDGVTGYRTRSMMCAPIAAPGPDRPILGVVQVLNKSAGERDFNADDLAALSGLAGELATLLDDTSLRSQLRPEHDKPLAFRFNFIVGESSPMQTCYDRIARAAATEAHVLLRGETGTGKTLFARAIHFNSDRRSSPLVKVDCAALPANLIENELFGHEKGAYTGADQTEDGKVAAASGGTLFLDEIGELPLEVQGKLLRLMQERTYLRVGGTRPQAASVRFVCATQVDLEQAVRDGTFRADLYYRIRVLEVEVPPLRDRGHVDLDRLVDHFLYEFSRRHGRPGLQLSTEARAALHAWSWPGNVRELEHCIESAVILADGQAIAASELPLKAVFDARPEPVDPTVFRTRIRPLRDVETAYCHHVVQACGGNQSQAAAKLEIGRNTLARKLKMTARDPGMPPNDPSADEG